VGENCVNHFPYRQGELFCESVPVDEITRRYGTPAVIYSAAALRENAKAVRDAFDPVEIAIRFPVQTLPSPGVLRTLTSAGCGMAALTAGELERAWLSKSPMTDVHFAGVGKTDDDIRAALDGIYSPLFQAGVTVGGRPPYYRGPTGWLLAESIDEIERIALVAASLRVNCRVALRINTALEAGPDEPVDPADAESKFGMPPSIAPEAFRRFDHAPHLKLAGLASHVGQSSQHIDVYLATVRRVLAAAREVTDAGFEIDLIDLGGGLPAMGVSRSVPPVADYARPLIPELKAWTDAGTTVAIQPGRAIAASAGVLVVTASEVKPGEDRRVVVCDTGLNPAVRPHDSDGFRLVWPTAIDPADEPPSPTSERLDPTGLDWADLVGPTGRNTDGIGRGRLLPPVESGDRLAVFAAGADALATIDAGGDRPFPAEVLVKDREIIPLRPRAGLVEHLAPELGPLEKL
jgi:diaminopimelate decarboxylase